MPAKRKPLPRECPKCGLRYGTVQMVFFAGRKKPSKRRNGTTRKKVERYLVRDDAVIRIGHYDSDGYFEARKENASVFNDDSEEAKDRNLRTSQRRWCSFRSEVLDDYMFERALNYGEPTKTITESINAEVWNKVIEDGWGNY